MSEFKVVVNNDKASIHTPYNSDFVKRVKLLSGRWNGVDRCWTVSTDALDDVRAAMRDIYGRDDNPVVDTVDVLLTFSEVVYECCAPIEIYGRTVARAFGRDSGAKTGEDVLFVSGSPKSGGSAKYWQTVIPEGCVVKMLGVPRASYEQADLPRGVNAEIINTRIDREALIAERERLMARLAEIDNLLK